ncbi:hypothetical protein [Lysobacter gummosus]
MRMTPGGLARAPRRCVCAGATPYERNRIADGRRMRARHQAAPTPLE